MIEAAAAPLPSPAAALQRRFETIWRGAMADVPILNPALQVRTVGFRPWQDHWLGVLITPWFMNLMLLPRLAERWPPSAEGESRPIVLPAGVFEFIGARDKELGPWLACSLFSPMFEFHDMAGAEATALAVLQGLFDGPEPAPPPAADLAKRSFLFGSAATRG